VAVVVLAVLLVVALIVAVVALVRYRGAVALATSQRDRAEAAEAAVVEAEGRAKEATARATELQEQAAKADAARDEAVAALAEAVAERDRLQLSMDDTSGELARLDDQLAEMRTDLANAKEAAREAEQAAVTAVAQAHTTEAQLSEARAEVEQLRGQLESLRARPVPADAERPEAAPLLIEGLWALERARIGRTWRQSVALDPSDPGPFTDDADPVRTAVEVGAAAVREEVGSVFVVDWQVEGRLSAGDGLLVVRSAEELLVSGSRVVEDGVLVVARDGDEVVLALRGPGGEPVDAEGLEVRVAVGA